MLRGSVAGEFRCSVASACLSEGLRTLSELPKPPPKVANSRASNTHCVNRWHNYYVDAHPHFCTASVVDWRPLLTGAAVDIIYEEWDTARSATAAKVLAYVIMPDHIHAILWAELGKAVASFLRRTLSLTARRIQPRGGLWQERPRVLPIHSPSVLRAKVDYLHRNPLRKELAVNPEDWEHSSFRQVVLHASDAPFLCDDWEGLFVR